VRISLGLKESPSRAARIGLLLAAPVVVFVAANLLNEIGIGVLYAPIEAALSGPGRRELFNLISPVLFLVLPAIALALNLFAIARLDLHWERRQLVSTVTITPYAMNVAVLAGGGLALGALLAYLVTENFTIVLNHLG
jgi:hypothetical protein